MTMESERTILVDGTEYIASYHTIDIGDGKVLTFFHLDVFYFSASVLRRMLQDWLWIRKALPEIVFTVAETPSKAWERLVRRFGFQFLQDVGCSDNRTRPMFVHFR